MQITRRSALHMAGAAFLGSVVTRVGAEANANALRVLVGYSAGGATDVIARLIGTPMRTTMGRTVVVENVPGAGGRLALQALKRSTPEQGVVVLTPDFPLTLHPHLYRKLGYDPVADFMPVTTCGVAELALSVGPAVPSSVTTLAEFIQWCKSNPRQALYASPSPGSTPHFTGVMLAKATGVELTHVPYKGGTLALQDLLGGQVPASINPIGELLAHVQGDKLRVLATSGAKRSRFLPNVPTFVESGYPDLVVRSWLGLFLHAGANPRLRADIEKSVAEALKSASVVDGLAKFGVEPLAVSGAEFASLIQRDLDRWGPIVKASGFKIED